jgi:3-deoxy-D-manno-octulosonic-acid transferase
MHFFYSLLSALLFVLLSPYFFLKGLRTGKYVHNLRERFGHLPPDVLEAAASGEGAIWLHAVSVGEALAALPLARALKERYPERKLFVSTTTVTGQRLARERMPFADGFFYFPFDWEFSIRRVMTALRPALVVILETEIWPNFLRACGRSGVPVVFVNGRISERSFGRYRAANALTFGFLHRVLAHARAFLMQTEEDARRLLALGAPPERVQVTGNLKFDLVPPASTPLVEWLEREIERAGRRPLAVAGSVVADEEPYVLLAFSTLAGQFKDAFLVLAPRKPERFAAAEGHLREAQLRYLRRSQLSLQEPLPPDVSVLLLDSVGELAALYRLADAVFVGGSLVPSGGHNILEPAAFGKPPIFGPSMENFRELAALFLAAGAALQVHSPEDLGVAWIELYQDAARRERMGAAARALVERHRGATQKTLEAIGSLLQVKPVPQGVR